MAEENHVKTDFKSYNSQTIQNLVYWLLYESSEFCLPKISFQPTKLVIHTFRKAFLLKKCHSGKNLQNQARKQEQSIILKHNGHPNCLHMDYARFFQEMYVRNALVMTSFYDKCGSTEKKILIWLLGMHLFILYAFHFLEMQLLQKKIAAHKIPCL